MRIRYLILLFLSSLAIAGNVQIFNYATQQWLDGYLTEIQDQSTNQNRYFVFCGNQFSRTEWAAIAITSRQSSLTSGPMVSTYSGMGISVFEVTHFINPAIESSANLFTPIASTDNPSIPYDYAHENFIVPAIYNHGYLSGLYSYTTFQYVTGAEISSILNQIVYPQAYVQSFYEPSPVEQETTIHNNNNNNNIPSVVPSTMGKEKATGAIKEINEKKRVHKEETGPKKIIKKKRNSNARQFNKMTLELLQKMLNYEKENPKVKQYEMQKLFNVNRSTYWRWKKQYNGQQMPSGSN